MSSDKTAIRVEGVGKCFEIYEKPRDRLKQFIAPKFQRLAGRPAGQYFREFWALNDIAFEIKMGETVGIIGQNGSGKSTLLQIICGTLAPTHGSVEVNGRVAALLELGSGFNPEFTGRENAILNAAILGMQPQEIESKLESIWAFSELGPFLDQPVKTYSSGMYVRLAFAISVHVSPQILIVDEALAVGDGRFQAKCMRRIKDMQEDGVAILFVSHDVGAVRTLCQRAIWLDRGRLRMDGEVFPVTGAYTERLFDTSDEAQTENPGGSSLAGAGSQAAEGGLASGEKNGSLPAAIDSKPSVHWGSHQHSIVSAGVFGAHDLHTRRDQIDWNEEIAVQVSFNMPAGINREDFSVAFSIKDLRGTDLIVSTTHDFEKKSYADGDLFNVIFSFTNPLVEGKYLLVVALENRHYKDIHYFEYIEGAHYFSVTSEHRLFGIAQPVIHQTVEQIIST